MKNILVTIDFEEQAHKLIRLAVQMALGFQSKVWLLHIAAPNPDFVGYEVGPQYLRDFRADELRKEHKDLQSYVAEMKSKGVDAEGLLVQGPTVDTILAEANKLKVDLIIAGHHDRGFLSQALRGSVSKKIFERSHIPVMIVPLG